MKMKTKTVLKVLAATAVIGGLLGDCGTTLPIPIPLGTQAQTAPLHVHAG